ncbi:MAG: class I SAM-dependent methyltransferase [Chloroflexi bacterium]|nr:class I SAM-dependent methyltransferase [Chloroflexota bacterium]
MIQQDKAIRLGHPSYVWRFGQDRRLDLIRQHVPLEGARILDVGCGIGTYLEKFRGLTALPFGVDIDPDKLDRAGKEKGLKTLALAASEFLPFPSESFDAVLLHEVIEHVTDDGRTVREAHRVAKFGGLVLVFAPNRWYPFETHGVYLGHRYFFGNIPFVGYLPDSLRRRLAPHVRAYRAEQVQALFAGLDGKVVRLTQIYPGYDKTAGRRPRLARLFRRVTYWLESTPLRTFGLSHFLVWRKGHD